MDKSVHTSQVDEYAVGGDVLDSTFEYLAFFQFGYDFLFLFFDVGFDESLVGYNDVLEVVVDFDDLEFHRLFHELVVVAYRFYIYLRARKERFYTDAAAEYLKRLSRYCKAEVIELPEERLPEAPSPAQIEAALSREADAVRGKLPQGCLLIALCVEGKLCSSEELAAFLSESAVRGGSHVVFLIGSSFGLHPSLKAMAAKRLSLSPMTFPHHLARVMLLEQIYRAFQIRQGTKYHK